MAKSKDAFRTISEVADWLETPAHVLRFWESKFTQVKPVKRAGGRRYYRPADMKLLGGIKKLLHDDGLTIKGAQKLLREHGVKHVSALSQPLDEDLIEEAGIEEARYEDVTQADPVEDAPATVVKFRAKTDESTVADPIAAQSPEPSEAVSPPPATEPTEDVPLTAQHDATTTVETPTPLSEDVASEPAQTSKSEDSFTEDALPAFLRRSAPIADVPAAEPSTASAPPEPRSDPAKVTIDPVATLVPVAPEQNSVQQDPEPASTTEPEDATAAPQDAAPMFSHRTATSEPGSATKPEIPLDTAANIEKPTQRPPVDIPPIAKVAPEIDSYSPPSGVLTAIPSAKHVSVELAADIAEQLNALRALRNRMAG